MKILVVEDEHRIANTIKKGLEQERYVVDVCYEGTSGYDLAAEGVYDLIILDLMLPEMDGLAICQKLREKQIHTPVLILTAKSQVQDRVAGLDMGADDYLAKPFAFEELLARVRALSRRPKNFLEQILTIKDLKLDVNKFTVKRNEKEIKLSNKEFSLLEYLMHHPNQILSKEQITNHVWDYDSDVLPNTIEVYIRNLRNKIDQPFSDKAPLIQTVRGFGYKIG